MAYFPPLRKIDFLQDSDVFEITDFTTASEWERFIARLEEIVHEWKLASLPPQDPLLKVILKFKLHIPLFLSLIFLLYDW